MAVRKPLGERLVDAGLVTEPQLAEALRGQKVTGDKIGQTLVRLGHLTEEDLVRVLCEDAEIPFRAAPDLMPDASVRDAIPASIARLHTALPLADEGGRLHVALPDPFDMGAVTAVERAAGRPVVIVGAPRSALRTHLERAYTSGPSSRASGGEAGAASTGAAGTAGAPGGSGADGVSRAGRSRRAGGVSGGAERAGRGFGSTDVRADVAASGRIGAAARSGVESEDGGTAAEIADEIVGRGVRLGATDVHIEPEEGRIRVRYRIDGVLQGGPEYPKTALAGVVSRIKILAGLNIAETRLPQDGRVRMTREGREIDLRVSTFPTVQGEDVVLRVLDRARVQLELETLGMAPDDVKLFRRMLARPHGLIPVTGPTGSGKTTTLYSALKELNTGERCIITLEDPVEYELAGVRQSQVNPRAGLTFASGLRSMLRHDPDVALVGEMRDEETVAIALSASLTGHMVLATLHTNTAAGAIPRLMDMGAEPYVLASTIELVVAQRLVRRLCDACKEPAEVPESVRERLKLGDVDVYRSTGCSECRETGYRGRLGVYELIPVTGELAPLIYERRSAEEIQRAAGRPTLFQDGLRKVRDGSTSLDEVLRVTTR